MAVPPVTTPVDAQYMAFLKGSGLDDAQAQAEVQARRAELEAQKVLRRQYFAQELERQRGDVATQFSDQGFYKSGGQQYQDASAIRRVGQSQAEYEQGLNQSQDQLARGLENQLAQNAQRRAEEAIQAGQRVSDRQSQTDAANRAAAPPRVTTVGLAAAPGQAAPVGAPPPQTNYGATPTYGNITRGGRS